MEVLIVATAIVYSIATTIIYFLHRDIIKEFNHVLSESQNNVDRLIKMGKGIEDAHNMLVNQVAKHDIEIIEVKQTANFLKRK